ncbi:hypothetical protein OUZ56_011745 [Daphnia magna]|uniref:Uncharacterized protein n=1 Tax=Daphnia magna TaxID=35525 RepID=A0ABQ9Z109_9CRUS|nr:hypothetical protein OUZ56_011745 [Daphnia magna]
MAGMKQRQHFDFDYKRHKQHRVNQCPLTLAFQAEFEGTFKVPPLFWLMKGIGRWSTSTEQQDR